jgi:hypothetical protein
VATSQAESDEVLYVQGARPDGRTSAYATTLVGPGAHAQQIIHLQLFDLHSRMSAWALTSLWRADELSKGAWANLATWRIVSAAALARSLLEGALAFVAEAAEMASAWSEMKVSGPPEVFKAHELRKTLGDLLLQAQFGSRIGEPPLRRPLIMKLITAAAKEQGLDLEASRQITTGSATPCILVMDSKRPSR